MIWKTGRLLLRVSMQESTVQNSHWTWYNCPTCGPWCLIHILYLALEPQLQQVVHLWFLIREQDRGQDSWYLVLQASILAAGGWQYLYHRLEAKIERTHWFFSGGHPHVLSPGQLCTLTLMIIILLLSHLNMAWWAWRGGGFVPIAPVRVTHTDDVQQFDKGLSYELGNARVLLKEDELHHQTVWLTDTQRVITALRNLKHPNESLIDCVKVLDRGKTCPVRYRK